MIICNKCNQECDSITRDYGGAEEVNGVIPSPGYQALSFCCKSSYRMAGAVVPEAAFFEVENSVGY